MPQCHVSCLWLGILEGQFPSDDRGQTCPEAGSASRCTEFAEQHTDGLQAQRNRHGAMMAW